MEIKFQRYMIFHQDFSSSRKMNVSVSNINGRIDLLKQKDYHKQKGSIEKLLCK